MGCPLHEMEDQKWHDFISKFSASLGHPKDACQLPSHAGWRSQGQQRPSAHYTLGISEMDDS